MASKSLRDKKPLMKGKIDGKTPLKLGNIIRESRSAGSMEPDIENPTISKGSEKLVNISNFLALVHCDGYIDKINKELVNIECVSVRPLSVIEPVSLGSPKKGQQEKFEIPKEPMLELSLGVWSDQVDESFLYNSSIDYQYISLTIECAGFISHDLCNWISKHVSPKLIELHIIDCTQLTWMDHVKVILQPATNIEVIDLRKNEWVDDFVVEQLCVKFGNTLKDLNLEKTRITDNALFHLGKKCLNIKNLSFNCCPKISDSGFRELSRRIHLSNFSVSHNVSVTDDSIEAMLSTSYKLKSFCLSNCPKLTDRAIESMYEKVVAWGRKRNLMSAYVTELVLNDNEHFSTQIMVWLSTAVPLLNKFDIRDCPNIDISKGMMQFEILKNIEHLYLGPSNHKLDCDMFVESMLFHSANLRTLHLVGLSELEDTDVAEIITAAVVLTELHLSNINIGSKTIESICSNLPNIIRLSIIGSDRLSDADIRCLSSVTLHLEELTLQRCMSITDAGFTRCVILRRLTKLDVSYPSSYCNGVLLGCFTLCPLYSVVLDKINFNPTQYFVKMNTKTRSTIHHISFCCNKLIDFQDLEYILLNFPNLTNLNLTGCNQLLNILKTVPNPNKYLRIESTSDFFGYRINPVLRNQHSQHKARILQIIKHQGALKFQKLRRKYTEKIEKLRILAEAKKKLLYLTMVIKVQANARKRLTINRLRIKFESGRRIVRGARRFLIFRFHRKIVKGKLHYYNHLYRVFFNVLKDYASFSKENLDTKTTILIPKLAHRMKRRNFKWIKDNDEELKNNYISDTAMVIWENFILKKIIKHWKMIKWETKVRQSKLVSIFAMCIPVTHMNSFRQQGLVKTSNSFSYHSQLISPWLALCDDFIRSKLADLLLPKAAAHWLAGFMERTVRITYNMIHYYKCSRIIKLNSRKKSDVYYDSTIIVKPIPLFAKHIIRSQRRKENTKIADDCRRIFRKQLCLKRFPAHFVFSIWHIQQVKKGALFAEMYFKKTSLKKWTLYLIRKKKYAEMNFFARKKCLKTYGKHTIKCWKTLKTVSAHLAEYYFKEYINGLVEKAFKAFKKNLNMKKEYLAELEAISNAKLDTLEEVKLPENCDALVVEVKPKINFVALYMKAITKLQSRYRGMTTRVRIRELKINSLYAIQTLQNFSRVVIAKKKLREKVRKNIMRLRKNEGLERDLMLIAEKETQYYEYFITNATHCQRVFRGWVGRVKGALLAAKFSRYKNRMFYESMQAVRDGIEARRRALLAKERKRDSAVTLIQKRIRGVLARKYFIFVKLRAREKYSATYLQKKYRRRLGISRLRAMRREMVSVIRFRSARAHRGSILRMLGLKKRNVQSKVGVVLEVLGIDPISFLYRIDELIEETKIDFEKLKEILYREYAIYEKIFSKPVREIRLSEAARERRVVITDAGWALKLDDCVKILEEGHPFVGYTGIIVRIDSSLVGFPLFEVKLDAFLNRQTFVKMTTDPVVVYNVVQPLVKIEKLPILIGFEQKNIVYGLNPDDPECASNFVEASWIIQRAYRIYRSKKIAARKRYEMWLRSIDMQISLYNHLKESNSLTFQANFFMGMLGLKPKPRIFYDEVRHTLIPQRLEAANKIRTEKESINEEFEFKYQQRMHYLEKSTLRKGKIFFVLGHERITFGKKLGFTLRKICGFFSKKDNVRINDIRGVKGTKLLAKNKSIVTGMDAYCFKQFIGSPHVRYTKKYLYQGEWTGIPLFTPLHPHGEGLIVMMDGWGFAKEDKVLYLTIKCCRYLNAADLDTSDPYCDIICNGKSVQTSIKWTNLNPVYNEDFEIDVTNPSAFVTIIVKDKDIFGDDDFLGQLRLNLSNYADGKERSETHLLRGEEDDGTSAHDGVDYGEIDIRLRWAERKFEDDLEKLEIQMKKIVILQAWARRVASIKVRNDKRKERADLLIWAKKNAIKITSIMRMRMAYKKLKFIIRRHRAAIKIQKRIRIFHAKRKTKHKFAKYYAVIKIQKRMRGAIARMKFLKLKKNKLDVNRGSVVMIQKYGRRLIEQQRHIERLKKIKKNDDDDSIEPALRKDIRRKLVKKWLKTYGVDPDYGLRRNRRMTEAAFQRMLKMEHVRLQSRYGIVYNKKYPAPLGDDEQEALEKRGVQPLTNREDFIMVYFPPFKPNLKIHRAEAIDLYKKFPHTAFLHLKNVIHMRKSVDYTITIIQCRFRQKMASEKINKMLRLHRAITKFQRIFRKRNVRTSNAAFKITACFRAQQAKRITRLRRLERKSAIILQCQYRYFQAQCKLFDNRSVAKLEVLKATSFVENKGPEKCLEHRSSSFWMSSDPKFAEIRIEFAVLECITEIWIQTSTGAAQPQTVTFATVMPETKNKFDVLKRAELPYLKGERWHKFLIPQTISKYYRFTFEDNYGDLHGIAVRQIRFLRCKEQSAIILKQPENYITKVGPTVGSECEIILHCDATGWPRPTFQWYKDDVLLEGANKAFLPLTLKCKITRARRRYRCIKCKMVCNLVPMNAFHTRCSNCSYLFSYKEIGEYDALIAQINLQVKELQIEIAKQQDSNDQIRFRMESNITYASDEKYVSMFYESTKLLNDLKDKLQSIYESYYEAKTDLEYVNKFSNEGIYCCHVRNNRGGSMEILKKSIRTVVVVEHSVPYVVRVKPEYRPRRQVIRKKWLSYSSIRGMFRKGELSGLVVIYYSDGSFYEGPYIEEKWINMLGRVLPLGISDNHFGVFTCPDGRVFEGNQVTNHFDPFNLQTFYRLIYPNGEVYEGLFCDELFHGVGMYKYKDGSVYEGQWHRGNRFGHGHMRSVAGWTYEGNFDKDRKHGEGVMSFADGATYMGEWYYDYMQGQGLFLSHLRDLYKGSFHQGVFEGFGRMYYANGAMHVGYFKGGERNGKGCFTHMSGCEYYGHYVNDELEGEVVVKQILNIEELGQENFDIRVAIYHDGDFVKYKSISSNPQVTKRFIQLFRYNREMFDSVYSMILAKNLPNMPQGVDSANEDVRDIIFKLRNEAGMLVGLHALQAAEAKIKVLSAPISDKKAEIKRLQDEIESLAITSINLYNEMVLLKRDSSSLLREVELEIQRMEQYWADDPMLTRYKFRQVIKNLSEIEADEFFLVKNHQFPPPFVKKILDAISYLLGSNGDWKSQQMILSNSVFNSRMGDEDALRFSYGCKLNFMMSGTNYNVYDYVKVLDNKENMFELQKILSDPRFRVDSYYVESCGSAAPHLVDWIKKNYNLLKMAKQLKGVKEMEEKKINAFRISSRYEKKQTERNNQIARSDISKAQLKRALGELEDLDLALAKANDMMRFVSESFDTESNAHKVKLDYYQLLEKNMESGRSIFEIEMTLEKIFCGIEERVELDEKAAIREAMAKGKKYVKPEIIAPNLEKDWLLVEIKAQQAKVLEDGFTLGYEFEKKPNAISYIRTKNLIEVCAILVIGNMNDFYNADPEVTTWYSLKGYKFTSRFVFCLAWKLWNREAIDAEEKHACESWVEIFKTPTECAIMAIQAKVNTRMSANARYQGEIWARKNPSIIAETEKQRSDAFELEYYEDTASYALDILDDQNGSYPPNVKADCTCWAKYNSIKILNARDIQHLGQCDEFVKRFSADTGEVAFTIINGLGTEDESGWIDYALQWRAYNSEEFQKISDQMMSTMANEFAASHGTLTYWEAATCIDNEEVSKYCKDAEVIAEYSQDQKKYFAAKCYGVLNQGMLRKGNNQVNASNVQKYIRCWTELQEQTANMTKGSWLLTSDEHRRKPDLDRFSGFRNRLKKKFDWTYGYLCKKQDDLIKELEEMVLDDPIHKSFHNIRPSERDATLLKIEQDFLKKRSQKERELSHTHSRISDWNTYFGLGIEEEEDDDNRSVSTHNSKPKISFKALKETTKMSTKEKEQIKKKEELIEQLEKEKLDKAAKKAEKLEKAKKESL